MADDVGPGLAAAVVAVGGLVGVEAGFPGVVEEQAHVLGEQMCSAHPQIFLRELRDTLAKQGVRTSTSGLWRFFGPHGISRKKGLFTQPNSNART